MLIENRNPLPHLGDHHHYAPSPRFGTLLLRRGKTIEVCVRGHVIRDQAIFWSPMLGG